MTPMLELRLALGDALSADTTTLAPAVNANKIALVMADFVPSEGLVAGDLSLATFDGGDPIAGATGAQLVGVDPVTGQQVIDIKEPLGGWRWEVTGATDLPQTIYGFALLDSTLATLFAVEHFDEPITLNAEGQFIEVPYARLTFVLAPIV